MTFINEGNPNYVEKLVNFEKMVSLSSRLFPTTNLPLRLMAAFFFFLLPANDRQDSEGGARVQESALQ